MKRNTALFGASAAVGLTAAAGLIMTSATSSAATASPTYYGLAYSTTTAEAGFAFGTIINPDYIFTATASQVGPKSVVEFTSELPGASMINVTTKCQDGAPAVTVKGKTYTTTTVLKASTFTGSKYAVGNVTLLKKVGEGITVGAYYDLTASGTGKYIEIGGVSGCTAATTTTGPTSSTSTSPTTGPTSTTTGPTSTTTGPTSTTTGPTSSTSTSPTTGPTSTTTGPTSTTTTSPTGGPTSSSGTPTSTATGTSSPTSSPTSTTQPPTPTATTTTLPVTG